MGRRARLILPDLPVHVVHRGNNRFACFGEERDYLVYRALLLEGIRRFGCAVHAYCLMSNHVHMLLTPPASTSLAGFMHGVAQRYAHYYNQQYERTGTLWEGRFRSSLVDSSEYLLACYRYIELNPVRAGLVTDPSAYRWSSYRHNAEAHSDPLVSLHPGMAGFGASAYAAFVSAGTEQRDIEVIRDAINGGFPLGSESFRSVVAAKTGKQTERRRPGRPKKEEENGKSAPVPDLFSGGGAS